MKRGLVLGGMVLLMAVAAGAQTLTGQWSCELEFDLQQPTFSDALTFGNTLIVQYAVGGWTFGSISAFSDNGWSSQLFTAAGLLGAYTFDTSVVLGATGTFQSWVVTVGLPIGGMTFGMTTTLDANGCGVQFTGAGSTDIVDVSAALSFGDPATAECDLDWQGLTIEADFPFCCADVILTLAFDCTGFDSLTFDVSNLSIEALPWLAIDATLEFGLESKTLVLAPDFDFGEVGCDFDLYLDVTSLWGGGHGPTSPLTASQWIKVDGIKLSCFIGDVQFLGVSYWGSGGKPSILAGTDYWEGYQISTTDDACCGGFAFDVEAFFDVASTALFDLAAFEANVELEVSPQLTFSSGFDIDVIASVWTWSIGFAISW